jgi:biotin carboxylase
MVLCKLLGLPVRVTCVQMPEWVTKFTRGCVDRLVEANFRDESTVPAIARQVHAEDPFDLVLTHDEYSLELAARIGEELGLTGRAAAAVRRTRDKAAMREALHAAGADRTRFRLCRQVAEAVEFAAGVGGGVVLKPPGGAGSEGVHSAAGPQDVPAAWDFAVSEAGAPILAEERLAGPEYSVETLSSGGRHVVAAVTAKTTTGPPYFIETGHAVSPALPAPVLAEITGTVRAALDALGVDHGPAHTEVIVSGGQASIIEVNTRLGGDYIWELVELATGCDLFRAAVAALAGDLPEPPPCARGAAVAFTESPDQGLVKAVEGVADAQRAPGVIRVGGLPAVSTVVRPLTRPGSRLGHVIAVGATAAEAGERARHAASLIKLDLTPLTGT